MPQDKISNPENICVDAREFMASISLASRFTAKKGKLPVLHCVRLNVSSGSVEISATNSDQTIITSIDGDGSAEVDVMVPPYLLKQVAKCGDQVEISNNDGGVNVSCGGSEVSIAQDGTISPDEMPKIPECEWVPSFEIGESEFRELVHLVSGAMSSKETRYYLNGVHLRSVGGKLLAEATDGWRLYLAQTECNLDRGNFIVPSAAIKFLSHFLRKRGNGSVNVCVPKDGGAMMKIEAPSGTIITKLIDGTFPDIDRVVPKDAKKLMAKIKVSDASAMARAANGYSEFRSVTVDAAEGKMHQRSLLISSDFTRSIDVVPDAISFLINVSYLRDVTSRFGSVEVWGSSPHDPLLMKLSDKSLTCVVMPMRA